MRTVATPRYVLGLVALGVVIRMTTLSYHSLWLDEAFSVLSVQAHAAAEIWSPGIDPIHPPLFYLILQRSLALVGVSEFGARLPSALASVANIGLIWWLGQRVFPHRGVGAIAAALLAVAPIDLWYAQEARMYALVTMAGLVFALGLVIEAWWSVLLVVIGLAAGLYLDHTMWPLAILVASLGVTRWLREGRAPAQMVRSLAGIVVAVAMCGPVWRQAHVAFGELGKVSLFKALAQVIGVQVPTGYSLPAVMLGTAAVVFALVGVAAQVLWRNSWRRAVPVAIAAAVIIATFAVAVPRAYSLKQVLVCVWPYLVLLTAWALTEMNERDARGLGLTAIGVSLCACVLTFTTPRADWRGVSAHVIAHAGPNTRVVLDPPYNGQPWSFYRRPGGPAVVQTDGRDTGLLERMALANVDLCLVAERFGGAPPSSKTEAWMDEHLSLANATRFARLELRCYRPRSGSSGRE